MAISHLLEDFTEPQTGRKDMLTDVMLEELKLQAFETGYQAGWDDSAKAQHDSTASISEDFARNIRDLSFTYHEAHAGFITAIEPLIRQIVATVLPALARDTLGIRVAGLLQEEIEAHGPQPVRLITAPGSAEALRAVLPEDGPMMIEIREDSTLAEGQVQLRIGEDAEREIDLREVLDAITAAVEGFFQEASHRWKETA